MRSRLCTIIACLAIASCTEQSADLAAERQGIAELRVDAASLSEANVTRVVVQRGEETQELVRNNATGNYDGAILLAPGPQTLVARAFFLDELVGVSNPVTVDVTPGGVNRVILRIRDLTSNTPEFGPVLDSLTFPTSVSAETIATFAMSAYNHMPMSPDAFFGPSRRGCGAARTIGQPLPEEAVELGGRGPAGVVMAGHAGRSFPAEPRASASRAARRARVA